MVPPLVFLFGENPGQHRMQFCEEGSIAEVGFTVEGEALLIAGAAVRVWHDRWSV